MLYRTNYGYWTPAPIAGFDRLMPIPRLIRLTLDMVNLPAAGPHPTFVDSPQLLVDSQLRCTQFITRIPTVGPDHCVDDGPDCYMD